MADLLFALGVIAAVEGLALALIPDRLTQMLEMLRRIPPDRLRVMGLAVATFGVALVWLARGGGG